MIVLIKDKPTIVFRHVGWFPPKILEALVNHKTS